MKLKKLIPFFFLAMIGVVGIAYIYRDIWTGFSNTYTVNMFVSDVDSLPNGTFVYFDGLRVGTVTKTELLYPGVKVKIEIDKNVKIPANAEFSVNPRGLVGSLKVNIYSPAESAGYYIKDGDVVEGRRPATSSQLISNINTVSRKVDRIIDEVDSENIGRQIKDIVKDYNEIIKPSLENTINNINELTSSINEVMDKQTLGTIVHGVASFSSFLGAIFGNPSLVFSARLPSMSHKSSDYFFEVGVRTNFFLLQKHDFKTWSSGYTFMFGRGFIFNQIKTNIFIGVLRDSFGFMVNGRYGQFLWADMKVYDIQNLTLEGMLGVILANTIICGPSYSTKESALSFTIKFDSGL